MDQNSNIQNTQPVQTPVYGAAPQAANVPTVTAAPAAAQAATPVYAPQPAPQVIYSKVVDGQTIYVDAQGNQVQPIFVDAQGRPVAPPAPLTPAQQYTKIRHKVRTDMGRHGGVLLIGQLIASGVLILGMIVLISVMMVQSFGSGNLSSFTDSSAMENSFPYLLLMAIATLIGNTVIFIPFAKKRGVKPFSVFPGGQKPTAKWFFGTLLAGLGLNYLWGYIYMGLCYLFPVLSGSNLGMDPGQYDLKTLIVYIVMVCVIAPITEEFMFRGVLLHSLRRYGDRLAIIATAAFFGLLHGNLAQTPMAFLLGLVLGYVAVKTGNIWYTILIHFINNAYATLTGLLPMYLPQAEDILNYVDLGIGALLVIGMIVLLIVKRKSIDFPKDSEEVKAGPIRHRYVNFFTAFWNIFFVVFMIGMIVFSMFQGDLMSDITSEMESVYSSDFISGLSRIF